VGWAFQPAVGPRSPHGECGRWSLHGESATRGECRSPAAACRNPLKGDNMSSRRFQPTDPEDGCAFPSYLQAGPSFFIEKSKRRMIAEDLKAALRLLKPETL